MDKKEKLFESTCKDSTNRGVTFTCPSPSNADIPTVEVRLDWVSFTVWERTVQDVAEWILCLPAEDFLHTELNIRGFRDNYEFTQCKGISIATNGLPEQGIHVTVTGQGCLFLFSQITPQVFVQNVLEHHGRFSRVDLALDDYMSQWYTVPQLIKYLKRDELICRWKTYTMHQGGHINNKRQKEEALYLGSAKSDFCLKIYNKTLEQRAKRTDSEALAILPEAWTRWEFCCRNKQAHKLMETLLIYDFRLGEVFSGLLHENMRICKDSHDKNKWRRPARQKWNDFIGAVAPICLRIEKPKSTMESKREWLRNQVGPTLAAVLKTKDGFAYLLETAAKADAAMDSRMEKMVEAYNERVQDDDTVKNLVHKNCVPYVLELQDRCFLEGPPPDDEESA
ncbi:MAG: replication initiation factor domain-containing protein [Peptococcaceae bacterium]|nr:replication initiation factor domain-containing protein [Peptococcaceae bacterium]